MTSIVTVALPVLVQELPVRLVDVEVVVLSTVVLLFTEGTLDGVRRHDLDVGHRLVAVEVVATKRIFRLFFCPESNHLHISR